MYYTEKLPVQVVTRKMVKRNLNVYYPMVIGMRNQMVQQRINNDISRVINALIEKQGYYENPSTEVIGWYELKTNERGVLSLSLGNYAYPPHAAHGMTYIKSLTFNIETGKTYLLSELFKPDSDYIKVISDNIRLQIQQRNIPLLDQFDGINPNQDYYLADKALVVYYQLYEITPYVYGFPMFPISVYDLQDITREGTPLAKMETND